jgi:hypothetical protein
MTAAAVRRLIVIVAAVTELSVTSVVAGTHG